VLLFISALRAQRCRAASYTKQAIATAASSFTVLMMKVNASAALPASMRAVATVTAAYFNLDSMPRRSISARASPWLAFPTL
jgi:hypothetical protein